MRTTPNNNRCVPVGLIYNIMCVVRGVLSLFKHSSGLSGYEKAAPLASAPPYSEESDIVVELSVMTTTVTSSSSQNIVPDRRRAAWRSHR